MLYQVFLTRLYRSGGGVVLAVPKSVRENLGLSAGDECAVAIVRILPAEAKIRTAAYLERAIETGLRRLDTLGVLSPLRPFEPEEEE